jgi:hypothetical protein
MDFGTARVLPDGTRLEPLDRDSRRLLEKELCPTFTETSPSGQTRSHLFRWSVMDDRIFEVASGARGTSTWDAAAFKEAFPEQARFLARYQARVQTLKTIGYLSPEGSITSAFRVHFAAHHGVLSLSSSTREATTRASSSAVKVRGGALAARRRRL